MACDGDIDKKEVVLIKEMQENKKLFGDIDINEELERLLVLINEDGQQFLKNYFNELSSMELTTDDELKLIEVAIDTIKADEKVEYSEIKFFKVIRSKLKIKNQPVLEIHPDFEEYLQQDIISQSYLAKLQDDFFDTHTSKTFESLHLIDNNLLNNLEDGEE